MIRCVYCDQVRSVPYSLHKLDVSTKRHMPFSLQQSFCLQALTTTEVEKEKRCYQTQNKQGHQDQDYHQGSSINYVTFQRRDCKSLWLYMFQYRNSDDDEGRQRWGMPLYNCHKCTPFGSFILLPLEKVVRLGWACVIRPNDSHPPTWLPLWKFTTRVLASPRMVPLAASEEEKSRLVPTGASINQIPTQLTCQTIDWEWGKQKCRDWKDYTHTTPHSKPKLRECHDEGRDNQSQELCKSLATTNWTYGS